MWTTEDKEIAERAAQTLAKLQGRKDSGTLEELKSIRDQVANKRSDEHERAEAWLSVCRLVESLEKSADAGNIDGLWHRALQATNAWRGTMRNQDFPE
jgi:hypothetical protein